MLYQQIDVKCCRNQQLKDKNAQRNSRNKRNRGGPSKVMVIVAKIIQIEARIKHLKVQRCIREANRVKNKWKLHET